MQISNVLFKHVNSIRNKFKKKPTFPFNFLPLSLDLLLFSKQKHD
jgi:hypothetical protein